MMHIEAKLILSKFFPRGVSKLNFGRYEISPSSLFSAAELEILLTFPHTFSCPDGKCHPEEEVDIISRLLSVFFNARIRKAGTEADDNSIPIFDGRERTQYPQFFGYFESESLDDLIKKVLSLDEKTAKQFIRACRCYSYALDLLSSDPHFAFFFLITSGEFMASQNSTDSAPEKKAGRFCNFITKHLPDELKGEDATVVSEMLCNAYDYFSADYLIGGKGIFSAALDADKANANYSTHSIEGKEVKLPGFTWLSNAVRGALIGYLNAVPAPSGELINEDLFSALTLEKSKLK